MAIQSFYIDEAKKALNEAITEMEEMSSKFTDLNNNMDANINAASGSSMAGQVGSVAANVWNQDNVEIFNQLIAETRDFNEHKVTDMINNYSGYTDDAFTTYQS